MTASGPQQLEGKVLVSVIGAQRQGDDTKHGYTGYRTVVVYRGECFERLVRYSEFRAFYRRLRTRDGKKPAIKFPAKRWTRKMSMQPEVIEERRVLLNDFMKKMCAMELAPQSEDALLRLLRFGKHEDASRASDSMFSRSIRSDLPSESLLTHPVVRKESQPLSAHEEVDENALSHGESEDAVNLKREVVDCLTLTDVDITVPSNTSSVGTVMTMDELLAVDEGVDSPAGGAMVGADAPTRTLAKSVSQELPTTTSSMLLSERPPLRTSQSLSMRRQKKVVAFAPKEGDAPGDQDSADPVDEEQHEDSPEPHSPSEKYLRSITLHMSMIHETLYGKDEATSDALPPVPST